jgi:hypothetical protein
MTKEETDACIAAIDEAWRAIDDNLYPLYERATTPQTVQAITDLWNALHAAHMKLTIARLEASSMNFKSLTEKVNKTTKAIKEALDKTKLGPEIVGMFGDATKLATTAVKFVDQMKQPADA